ncbi:hypothetical protein L2E82_04759 [Cichorium intybus]|uniref:Uncharacterized protein n=1 Tax=Cichorium intybus TaxID=13427 RepID=A0ACB9H5V1_CICIN|nr:hypothetical protein L2E82_04759 [Cichorium intybus]
MNYGPIQMVNSSLITPALKGSNRDLLGGLYYAGEEILSFVKTALLPLVLTPVRVSPHPALCIGTGTRSCSVRVPDLNGHQQAATAPGVFSSGHPYPLLFLERLAIKKTKGVIPPHLAPPSGPKSKNSIFLLVHQSEIKQAQPLTPSSTRTRSEALCRGGGTGISHHIRKRPFIQYGLSALAGRHEQGTYKAFHTNQSSTATRCSTTTTCTCHELDYLKQHSMVMQGVYSACKSLQNGLSYQECFAEAREYGLDPPSID